MTHTRIVLITGSSTGFGRLLVKPFLAEGWTVLASLRNAQRAPELFTEEMQSFGDRFVALPLDVTRGEDRAAAEEYLANKFGGRLDCLVNNAGFGVFGPLEEISEAQIREQMEVNFFGAILLTRALLPSLRAARGRVINISSVLGYSVLPMASMYCASKFALEGLSESLYYELQPHGVQVAIVQPGGFRTNFADNQQWGAAAETSPYRSQVEAFTRFRARRAAQAGRSPEPVIDAVLRLAAMRTMPLRVQCGKDANATWALKRLLPERLQTRLFSAAFRRLFS
jgi:NAD(P)-dependent dehydrogenase (short-subunit alcohol dehydrogenase family)